MVINLKKINFKELLLSKTLVDVSHKDSKAKPFWIAYSHAYQIKKWRLHV